MTAHGRTAIAHPQALDVRVSLHAGTLPGAGVQKSAFAWDDLLHTEPPSAAPVEPARLCIHGAELTLGGLRVELALFLDAPADPLSDIVIDDRIAVTERALATAIENERQGMGVRLARAQRQTEHHAGRRLARAERLRRHGGIRARVGRPWLAFVTFGHRSSTSLFGSLRDFTRGLVAVPDRIMNRGRKAIAFLATPAGRARFREGVFDPHVLTPHEKAVTLFAGVSLIFGTLLTAHVLVTLIAPQVAVGWRTVVLLYLYGFTTSLGVPIPIEPALVVGALAIGPAPTIGVTILAKVTAAWGVFFLGDEMGHRIRARAAAKPWFARLLARSEAFAQRFGVFAVAFFLAIPGLPDVIALYVFGSLHMRLWKYLLGVAIGGAVLYTAVLYGLLALLGWG